MKLNPEDQQEVETVFQEAGPIDVSVGLGGAMKFEEYLKIFSILVRLQIRFFKRNDDKYKEQRQGALKSTEP